MEKEGIVIRHFDIDNSIEKETFSKLMKTHFIGWWCKTYKESLEKGENPPFLTAFDKKADRVIGFIGLVKVNRSKRVGFTPGVENNAQNIYFEMGYQGLGIFWTLLKKKL